MLAGGRIRKADLAGNGTSRCLVLPRQVVCCPVLLRVSSCARYEPLHRAPAKLVIGSKLAVCSLLIV